MTALPVWGASGVVRCKMKLRGRRVGMTVVPRGLILTALDN